MKIWCLLAILVVFTCSAVFADSGLEIEKITKENIAIAEVGNPVYYDLVVDNLKAEDQFKFFTLVGVQIEPSEYITLQPGNTTVHIKATLSDKLLRERRGLLYFEYQVKGMRRDLLKDQLLVKIVSLKDVLDISYSDFRPGDDSVKITVRNKEDVRLDNLTLIFDSVFFRDSAPLGLGPRESKTFTVPLNSEGTESLVAGPYIAITTVVTGKEDSKIEGIVDFLEKEGTSVSEDSNGIIVRTTTMRKTNRGNTQVVANVSLKKDIMSRLFTSFSPEPDEVTRDGFFIGYVWHMSLNPSESLVVVSVTNYTIPFLILAVIIGIGIVARIYYLGSVSINKRVSLVRTRGGEFALRVVLRVRARKTIDKLQLVDSLPGMTKLYENYGKHPDMIEKDNRRLAWNIGHLRRGQERVYSYIVYSKLNIVGKFELPLAHATFEKNGKSGEAYSNRAYFAMEKS